MLILLNGVPVQMADVVAAIMNEPIESGYSLKQILRVMSSVLAGKTSIAPGNPTVVIFRDLNDTTNRVSANMSGSSRASITTNTG